MSASDQSVYMRDAGRIDAKEIASTVRLIGPQEAAQILETMKYQYQRKIVRRNVDALAEEMNAGRFVGATTIRIAYHNDNAYLIDGQHRLSAVVATKKPQVFTVVEEVAPSLDYVAWAYGNIDTGKKRSYSDLYNPMGLHEQLSLTTTQINNLSSAVDVMISGMRRPNPDTRASKADRIRIIELYAPYMREFSTLTMGPASREAAGSLNRAYVVAVAMVSLRWPVTSGAFSTALFWRGVATDDRLATKDPRKAAHMHLINTTMRTDASRSRASGTSTAYGARYIANCYNAYLSGKERTQSKVPDETAPFKMTGVPSDPREWIK